MIKNMKSVKIVLLLSLCGLLQATTTPSTTPSSTPVTATSTVVIVPTTETRAEESPAEESGPPKPRQKPYSYSLKVNSTILSRYSTTVVKSRTVNPEDIAQEASFLVTLPDSAFISNFSMTIKEEEYVAYVKEKEEAKQIYEAAVAQGQTAAHVEARDSNNFAVSVNIGPLEKIDFKLTYEELLQRRRGFYEQQINISPGQVVDELTVDVYITENNNISAINVPDIRNEVEIKTNEIENPLAKIDYLSGNQVHISYHPTREQQREASEGGVVGQFVVEYDVQRGGDDDAGELQVVDGYFVHFFAPNTSSAIKKHVVFVIDTSGSMSGRKIVQTREALNSILTDLRPDDLFSLVEFNSEIKVWNGESTVDTSNPDTPNHYPPVRPPFPPGPPSPPYFPPGPPSPPYYPPSRPAPPSLPVSSSPSFPSSSSLPASSSGLPPSSSLPASPIQRPTAAPPSFYPPSSSSGLPSLLTSPPSSFSSPSSSTPGSSSLPTSPSDPSSTQGPSTVSTTTPKVETTTEYFVPRNPIRATSENIRLAKIYVDSLVASGGTNINGALLEALKHTQESANRVDMVPLIVFLTDGEPTVGVTAPDTIIKNIKQSNSELDVPIYSLAFGSGADFDFLKKLSLQNSGFARRIYEASDASLQLQEFFQEILTPLLSNIKITYLEDSVANGTVSKNTFRSYFSGSELVLTGKLSNPDATDFTLKVEGTSAHGPFELTVLPHPPRYFPPIVGIPIDPEPRSRQGPYSNFLERLWAYRTIRELLDQVVEKDDEAEKKALKKEALDISLQYNFVTEVTSLVVVKPNATEEGSVTESRAPSAEGVASFSGGVGLLSSRRSGGSRSGGSRSGGSRSGGFRSGMPASPINNYRRMRKMYRRPSMLSSSSWIHPHFVPSPMLSGPPGPPSPQMPFAHTVGPFGQGLSGGLVRNNQTNSPSLPPVPATTTTPVLNWDNVTVHDNGTAVFPNGTQIELGFDELELPAWDNCTTTANESGTCRYIQFCQRPEYTMNFDNFMAQSCMVMSDFGELFFGVCCPDQDSSTNATTSSPSGIPAHLIP